MTIVTEQDRGSSRISEFASDGELSEPEAALFRSHARNGELLALLAARDSNLEKLAAKLRREEEKVVELAATTKALRRELARARSSRIGRLIYFFQGARDALRSIERNVRLFLRGRKSIGSTSRSKVRTDEKSAGSTRGIARRDKDFLCEQSSNAARQVLDEIRSRQLGHWGEENTRREKDYGALRATMTKRRPRVMIGTLCSGEPEFKACVQSIKRQGYGNFEHVVISNLPKKRAMDSLYRKFLASDFEILIKIDADMVVLDEQFVERVVNVLRWNPKVALLQMAITDFYSGCEIQGVNAYTKQMAWNSAAQDPLFTDKTNTRSDMRLVVWSTFRRSVIHAPNSDEFHAFHFGVHRAIKVRASAGEPEGWERAIEQFMYLERTFEHYKLRRSRNLLFASLGGELALHGAFDVSALDYENPLLRSESDALGRLTTSELERKLDDLRARPASDPFVERLRARRTAIAARPQVRRLLLLVPHFKLYGGVNRFFEIARAARLQGVEAVVAAADVTSGQSDVRLSGDFPDVETMSLEQAFSQEWDVAICGDYSSGLMCLLPWVKASLSAIYLLNGWSYRSINLQQIELASPELVLANSSYSAEHYPEYAPTVVAGGIDLTTFHPDERRTQRDDGVIRIFTPAGRLKEKKRFNDVVEACLELRRRGISIELHVLNASQLNVQIDVPHVVHVGLLRREVADLLRSVDFAVCPEMDAGWNNPAAEAMACGVPLVCTRAGSTDFALDGKTALVVEPQRPDQIADAVERLARDAALAARLSEEGLRVIAQYSWFNLARKLIDTVEGCRFDLQSKEARSAQARARIVKTLMQ